MDWHERIMVSNFEWTFNTEYLFCIMYMRLVFNVQKNSNLPKISHLHTSNFKHYNTKSKHRIVCSMFEIFHCSLCITVSLVFQFGVTTSLIFGFSFLSLFFLFMPNLFFLYCHLAAHSCLLSALQLKVSATYSRQYCLLKYIYRIIF